MKQSTKLLLAFAGGMGMALAIGAGVLAYKEPGGPAAAPAAAQARSDAPDRAAVSIGATQQHGIGLKVVPVTAGDVAAELRVVATLAPDESRISHIHTRVAGWIEKLHVAGTGETVRAGQPIVDIYSQELLASQAEYLAARQLTGPPSLAAASGRTRLQLLGMAERDIAAIEASGKPQRVVTLFAPRSGVVAHRGIAVGTAVDPSTEIAIVLDLSRVWAFAEVPESAAGLIRKGMPASLAFGAAADGVLPAAVEFIDPLLSEASRTLKVRVSLPNRRGALRPGMYGTATFALPPRRALTVPRDALVDTGSAQYVYVAHAGGHYEPRTVRVGARLKDTVEILDGLGEGEQVVASGVFLLDSESRLRASGGQGTAHGGHGAPAAPAQPAPGAHAGARHD